VQARDRVLEALVASVDFPLPENVVRAEVDSRHHTLDHQLEAAGMSREDFLAAEGQTAEEFDADIEARVRRALRAQLVLDKVVEHEQLAVTEAELSDHIVRTAVRYGMAPEQFAQQVMQTGQLQGLVGEVVRGKALALVLERAAVTDASGRPVDLEALRADATAGGEDEIVGAADSVAETEPAEET